MLDPNITVDFILTDPPYGEMLSRRRTGERKKKTGLAVATPFTEHESDLGNMNQADFLESLKDIISTASKYLKVKGYTNSLFLKRHLKGSIGYLPGENSLLFLGTSVLLKR